LKIAVVGAGQMGSIFGAAASENGHDVLFVDTNQATVDQINAEGLVIDRRDGRSDLYRIPASSDPGRTGGLVDVALFQVKGWATRDAAERVRPIVAPGSIILTLQNGLGNEGVLRSMFPGNRVLIGVSLHTVITVGSGHYSHTGVRDTAIGPSDASGAAAAVEVGAVFARPDAAVHVLSEAEVRREQWAKFVLNCASLPTMALTRLPTNVAKDEQVVFDLMDRLTRETCDIAHAEGIDLDADERVAFQHDLFRTAGGRASMLGDVLARRRTEIDTINGAAITYADQHGLPAPLNRAMFALVKGLEKAMQIGEA
jgi:2-dehydropantoate 2-reductase